MMVKGIEKFFVVGLESIGVLLAIGGLMFLVMVLFYLWSNFKTFNKDGKVLTIEATFVFIFPMLACGWFLKVLITDIVRIVA